VTENARCFAAAQHDSHRFFFIATQSLEGEGTLSWWRNSLTRKPSYIALQC
jgi:hypothetical protein